MTSSRTKPLTADEWMCQRRTAPLWVVHRERDLLDLEVERLRLALEDATEYLRLASTWTVDTDRHDKLKRAWERGRNALALDENQSTEEDHG